MNKFLKKHKKLIDIIFIINGIVIFILAIGAFIFSQFFYINVSPSIPIGIYREVGFKELKKGDIVVFKMNPEFEKYSSTKNIKNNFSAKKIAAISEDKLESRNGKLYVNGEDYGEYIQGIPKAKLKVSKDGYWLLSKEPYSLDSRYYGEVKRNEILKKVKLVYEFKERGAFKGN